MLYIPIFLLLAVVVVFLTVVFDYIRLTRKYIKINDQESRAKEPFAKEASEITLKARRDAEKILSEAQISANQIVQNAKKFSDDEKKMVVSELNSLAQANVANFSKMVDETRSESVKILQNTSIELKGASEQAIKTVNLETTRQIADFQAKLAGQIDEFSKALLSLVSVEQKKVEDEIDKYKEIKLSQLNERILAVSRQISKEAVGKSISIEDQREFIINSLEEARKHKLFG